eukprot:GHRR01022381.1.p1 GENE.GHRR01022381.1~~GHRR01022381.1.p1  ORF type:complete len:452 (+),score=210.01 GHRR01022381.1:934-2289(+)
MQGRLEQGLTNWTNNNPAQHAEYAAEHLLQQHHHHNSDLLAAAAAVAPADILCLQQQLSSGCNMHIDMLGYGNVSRQEMCQLVDQVQQLLQPEGLPGGSWPPLGKVLSLSPMDMDSSEPEVQQAVLGVPMTEAAARAADAAEAEECAVGASSTVGADTVDCSVASAGAAPPAAPAAGIENSSAFTAAAATGSFNPASVICVLSNPNPANNNNAVYYSVQLGPDTVNVSVLLDLFVQMSSKAAFYELRTRQRLGYAVTLSSTSLHRQLGLVLKVQSPNTAPVVVSTAIRVWLTEYRHNIESLTTEQLQQHKQALKGKYLEPAKSLAEAARRTWVPILSRTLEFNRRQQKASAIEALSLQQLLSFYDTFLSPEAPQHQALCTQLWGSDQTAQAVANAAAAPETQASPLHGLLEQQAQVVVLPETLQSFKQSRGLMPIPQLHLPPAAAGTNHAP